MKFIAFAISIFVLLGCQDVERPEKPDNLISKEEMVSILTETYLGNAAASINNRTMRERGIELDSFVYAKYGIDSVQFARSNAFYTSDLDAYAEIFQKVEQRLMELQRVTDSLEKNLNFEEKAGEMKDSVSEDKTATPLLSEPVTDN
ncbi:MAG: hypothetical protein CMC08_08280 [Flavobacteriaceae bacterium]|nr:hypothetical protein [Flavobacteriaceae bacterium]